MKISTEVVDLAAEYASNYLTKHLDERFVYHDLGHTVAVVEGVTELCDHLRISKQQKRVIQVAAWFHDLGYSRQIEGHEVRSAQEAEKFLRGYHVEEEQIVCVKTCIQATKYPQKPVAVLEQIICDADMLHLSGKGFLDSSEKLRKEWQLTKGLTCGDKEWYTLNLEFLSEHRYHTSYAQKNLESRKSKNIKILKEKLKQIETNKKDNDPAGEKATQKKTKPRLERGVETLFRTTSGNPMRWSGMADNKTPILLGINSIIISVVLSFLARRLGEPTYLIVPALLLLYVSVTTMVVAVLTTKPKISKGVFTIEPIHNREANPVFFGNFHQMDRNDYERGIQEMMCDKDYLHKSTTRDIYFLGKVVAAKYRCLNIGYRIFMYGLITSVIAFGVSFLLAVHAA
jgi:predicted metal-dependent HD superfamily phosphohydrolase